MHDHVQAIHENQQHEQPGHQPHPKPWGEEACTVAGVGEICTVGQTEALNLRHRT